MKNILLPTDFSENAWNAISYALQLFQNELCTFYVLNIYTPTIYNVEYILSNPVAYELMDIASKISTKGLDKITQRIEKEFKNPKHIISQISSFNTLVGEIEALHKGHVMDLIVMGTKGATGAKKVLFGSNTVHVLNGANYPVLAVPENFNFEKPHDVLFPSDYNITFRESKLKPILDIAKQHHSRVNILHVFYGEALTQKQERNRKKLETYFKDTAYIFHRVKNKNIPEAISEFQFKTRVNLLVMINNKHSFFENLFFKNKINQIGFHLNIPILVIPSE
ncbi:universal stress protein [Bizionia myxarmorum]|uniref:Universal stress protein n=1 Tax=Bizionia myxarmorum TaxID=291186 RepID=A0A5D0RFF0_9FLAO|nr:universal stress protein [Bizionia myxarmorum]TYB79515.1 universal stress protein [Bizionia myxarmorum]